MKRSKKKIAFIVTAIVIVCGVLVTTVLANSSLLDNSIYEPKYEKPDIAEMTQDGRDPDEISSESSINAAPKEWYEYITYSETPVNEDPITVNSSTRVFYYDPFDYSYGLVMEADTNSETGFSSANKIKTVIKTTNSLETVVGVNSSIESSITATAKASAGAGIKDFYWAEVTAELTTKLSSTLDTNVKVTEFSETVKTTEKEFNAVYFNSNGVPYSWKLVEYTVYMPLKCDVQVYKNGTWVSTGEDVYCLLATVQGTCREYIKNNVAYIEHWGTGESVVVDDFWDGFFTADQLKEAYRNMLLPEN